VKKYFGNDIVIIYFDKTSDDAASEADVLKTLLDATKAASSEGNFDVNINSETYQVTKGKIYESIEDIYNPKSNESFGLGDSYINEYWYYKYSGVKVLTFNTNEGKMSIKFEKSKISL
jgi:hypothetical protein